MPASSDRTILVVFHEEVPGGATLSVLRLVPLLERRGWRFAFWAPQPSPLFDELRRRSHEVYGEPRHLAYSLQALRHPPGARRRIATWPRYFASLSRTLRDLEPAVVHANSLFTLAEALVARLHGLPTLLHVHEMVPPGRKFGLAKRLAQRHLQEVVAVSRASAERLTEGAAAPRLVYEAAAVPREPVSPRAVAEPFVVGTVGVISSRKGSDLFVEAARLLRRRAVPVEFRMIGDCTDVLEREWGLEVLERARALGVTHMRKADASLEMRTWDAFALPSRRDPFPIAMLEAMANGLPVIGTRVDGLAEQVTAESGMLVEPESPEELARAIECLAAQPAEARRAMGAAGRRRVEDHFTLEHQAEGLNRAYESAIRAGEA